jgi:protein-S-isoprenylcysteine O-methyltransferase Ste14
MSLSRRGGATPGARPGGPGNVPLPEPYLLGIAAAVWLDHRWPAALPGPRLVHHLIGWPLAVTGIRLIGRSWTAAKPVRLAAPTRLVTSGPYAAGRNPMYLGWALLQLGAGLVGGSGWMIAAVPAAAALVHREVRGEERMLEDAFGDEFRRYRAAVPRYLPRRRAGRRRDTAGGVDRVAARNSGTGRTKSDGGTTPQVRTGVEACR